MASAAGQRCVLNPRHQRRGCLKKDTSMQCTSIRAQCKADSISEASARMLPIHPFCRAISSSATAFASSCCLSRPSRCSWATLSDPSCCLCSSSSCCHLHVSRNGADLKSQSATHRLAVTALSAHMCLTHPSALGASLRMEAVAPVQLAGSYVHWLIAWNLPLCCTFQNKPMREGGGLHTPDTLAKPVLNSLLLSFCTPTVTEHFAHPWPKLAAVCCE